MNQNEKEIINILRKQKRMNMSNIAKSLNMPISTVADKMKKIEKKYLLKHSSILDYSKTGYPIMGICLVKIDSKDREKFLAQAKRQNCVNSIYHTNSEHNFMVEIICKNHWELTDWIELMKLNYSSEILHFQVTNIEEKEKFLLE